VLSDDLNVSASIDLGALFTDLGGSFTGADLGSVRFDAGGILTLVERAGVPDLSGVALAVQTASGSLAGRVSAGLPGAEIPGQVAALQGLVSGLGPVLGDVVLDDDTGLDALLARVGSVQSVVGEGPLAALFGLVPDLHLTDTVEGVGGLVSGLVELARVLAGLTATSAVSDRLVLRADLLAGRLDLDAARAAGDRLATLSADRGLVTALRVADPTDAGSVERLGLRVVAFLDAVVDIRQRWSVGMGLGEGALLGLDLAGGAAGLELAARALGGADLSAVGGLAATVRAAAEPVLSAPLPDPGGVLGDVVDEGIGQLAGLVTTLRAWDATQVVAPIEDLAGLALEPLESVRRMVEEIAGTVTSAIRALRGLVDEVDLSGVADAVRSALQPVVDTLDAIEAAVSTAEDTIRQVCEGLTDGLAVVGDAVSTAADAVREALGRVRSALTALGLAELADALSGELATVSALLASAQLSPYFDTAIDVIDTGAEVIEAVPFGLLPTDVQQEIVDVARPIKTLDLQEVEDALRGELEEIRAGLHAEGLAAVEEAFAAVAAFLASLDPEPLLQELEDGPMAELRAAVDVIDPEALLAPATDALDQVRGLLDGVDLRASVLDPLAELFGPVLEALADLDPAAAVAPVQETLDGVRASLLEALHLDVVTEAVTTFRARTVETLERIDPAALAGVLDEQVAARIAELPPGPPGGALGSLLVTLTQGSGLDATEPAVGDALAWVAGGADGSTVVRGRLTHVASALAGVLEAVKTLDPAPLTAAAQAQHRALVAALGTHPADSPLRQTLDPLLAGTAPSTVLGPLTENRRRYQRALEVDVTLSATLAASGRSEVSTAAADLHAALLPLAAIPARLRAILHALGLGEPDATLADLVRGLYERAGPARLLPALTELVTVGRDKVVEVLDVLLDPVLSAVADVRAIIDVLDVQPVIDELTDLHAQVLAEVGALSPDQLVGAVVEEAQQVVDRLQAFDPLGPVRDTVDAAKHVATQVLDDARPTVVFADVVELHHSVLALAEGLDVAALLRPVLEALDALAGQLDDGFDRSGAALQRLQAALPDQVTEQSVSGSVDVSIG